MEHEHVPQRAGQPATGEHVVADVRDPTLRQGRAALLEQAITHRGPDPRVHPVRDHVVECLRRQLEVLDRAHFERDVRKTERLHERAAARNRSLRRVDAVEARAGEGQRHRHEVSGVAASELQYPACLWRRGIDPEQDAEGGQPVRGGSGRPGDPGTAPRHTARQRHAHAPRARASRRTAQNFLFCLTSQPALIDAPSEPSGFCCLYSTWIFEKLSETESPGATSPSAPPVW